MQMARSSSADSFTSRGVGRCSRRNSATCPPLALKTQFLLDSLLRQLWRSSARQLMQSCSSLSSPPALFTSAAARSRRMALRLGACHFIIRLSASAPAPTSASAQPAPAMASKSLTTPPAAKKASRLCAARAASPPAPPSSATSRERSPTSSGLLMAATAAATSARSAAAPASPVVSRLHTSTPCAFSSSMVSLMASSRLTSKSRMFSSTSSSK
mmetsp:Transcript_31663/g.100567  ORF Transcript_31663/g.100567 Transcript_31663/m.100567 type:complete len:214 (+) Transcript_31663:1088-1729(+)